MTAYPYLALPTDCSVVLECAGMQLMLDAMATAMASQMVQAEQMGMKIE